MQFNNSGCVLAPSRLELNKETYLPTYLKSTIQYSLGLAWLPMHDDSIQLCIQLEFQSQFQGDSWSKLTSFFKDVYFVSCICFKDLKKPTHISIYISISSLWLKVLWKSLCKAVSFSFLAIGPFGWFGLGWDVLKWGKTF